MTAERDHLKHLQMLSESAVTLYEHHKTLTIFIAILCACMISVMFRSHYWHSHPDRAFTYFTGRALPSDIHAIAYAWQVNDNLFHVTRYWQLAGPPSRLHGSF